LTICRKTKSMSLLVRVGNSAATLVLPLRTKGGMAGWLRFSKLARAAAGLEDAMQPSRLSLARLFLFGGAVAALAASSATAEAAQRGPFGIGPRGAFERPAVARQFRSPFVARRAFAGFRRPGFAFGRFGRFNRFGFYPAGAYWGYGGWPGYGDGYPYADAYSCADPAPATATAPSSAELGAQVVPVVVGIRSSPEGTTVYVIEQSGNPPPSGSRGSAPEKPGVQVIELSRAADGRVIAESTAADAGPRIITVKLP
jgi:hypothetical protein